MIMEWFFIGFQAGFGFMAAVAVIALPIYYWVTTEQKTIERIQTVLGIIVVSIFGLSGIWGIVLFFQAWMDPNFVPASGSWR